MRSHKIRILGAMVLAFAGALLVGTLSFVAGFNFHDRAGDYYTPGFRASPGFMVDLLRAYTSYGRRKIELADPAEVRDLLASLSEIRVGVYRPWPDYDLPVLTSLRSVGLAVNPVEAGTPVAEVLKRYDVLVFPQGAFEKKDLPSGEPERIREMVQNGLGYIGICAGAHFAVRDLKIVEADWRPSVSRGLMKVRVLPGNCWGRLGGRSVNMHFANGGFFVGDRLGGWEPLMTADNFGVVAIRGNFGRGSVVLFTVHPEGGGITLNNQSIYFSGRDLKTGDLLLKAVLLARSSDPCGN